MTTDNPETTPTPTSIYDNNEDLNVLKLIIEKNPELKERVYAVMKKWLQKDVHKK